jgi:hypothetical protein
MDIKLSIGIMHKKGVEMASELYFSVDLKQAGEKIVCYYPNTLKSEYYQGTFGLRQNYHSKFIEVLSYKPSI